MRAFIIIYLKDSTCSDWMNFNKRLIKLTETRLLNKPSKEKTLKFVESTVITEFKFSIKLEKHISSPIRLLPTSRIASEIKELKYIKNSQTK